MSVKLVYERPKIHDEFSAVKSIVMELDDERNLDEMQDAFDEFLKAMGYNVPSREEEYQLNFDNIELSDNVLDTPPFEFGDSDVSMAADSFHDVNLDLSGMMVQDSDFGDTITLNLDDTYGATTSKLKVD